MARRRRPPGARSDRKGEQRVIGQVPQQVRDLIVRQVEHEQRRGDAAAERRRRNVTHGVAVHTHRLDPDRIGG